MKLIKFILFTQLLIIKIIFCIKIDIDVTNDDDNTNIALAEKLKMYNKTISQQEEMLTKMKSQMIQLKQENADLKENLSNLTRIKAFEMKKSKYEHPQKEKENTATIAMLQNFNKQLEEFAVMYQEMESRMAREKDLKMSLSHKIKEMTTSQRKIESMSFDISHSVKKKIDDLESKFLNIESINTRLHDRVIRLVNDKKQKIKIKSAQPGQDCNDRLSCNVCTGSLNCVWCTIEGKCKQGDSKGPFDGSCIDLFEYEICSVGK